MHTAIVLLIKPFVRSSSRCRRRRGFLKFPIIEPTGREVGKWGNVDRVQILRVQTLKIVKMTQILIFPNMDQTDKLNLQLIHVLKRACFKT